MNDINADKVRQFLLDRYAEQMRGMGLDPGTVSDSFDFLLEGVVDSFGVLEMVGAVEKEFGVELDMAGLDAEKMTVLGPLAHFIAEQTRVKQPGSNLPTASR